MGDEDTCHSSFYNLFQCLHRDSCKTDIYTKLMVCQLLYDKCKSTSIPSSSEMVVMIYPIASFLEIYSFLMHALRNGSPLRKINTGSLEISKSKKAICQHFLSSFNRKIKRKSTPTNERMKLLLKLVTNSRSWHFKEDH